MSTDRSQILYMAISYQILVAIIWINGNTDIFFKAIIAQPLEIMEWTPTTLQKLRNEAKLEAPLAVQGQSGHAGFFPFNKFSTSLTF